MGSARYPDPAGGEFGAAQQGLARAAQRLGSSNLSYYYEDFYDTVSWTDGSSGVASSSAYLPDATDAANAVGGVRRMQSGTDVGGVGRLYKVASEFPPTLQYNNAAIGFYRRQRFRIGTAADANMQCWGGSFNWQAGVWGANSTTKYSVRMSGTGSTYLTSTVSIDTLWHYLDTWFSGGVGFVQVDGETPVSAAAPAMPWAATQSFPDVRATKVTGATNYIMDVDHLFYAVMLP